MADVTFVLHRAADVREWERMWLWVRANYGEDSHLRYVGTAWIRFANRFFHLFVTNPPYDHTVGSFPAYVPAVITVPTWDGWQPPSGVRRIEHLPPLGDPGS